MPVKKIVTILIITIITLTTGVLLWNSEEPQKLEADYNHIAGEGWTLGSDNAPVKIETFINFECEICIQKEQMATEALEKYPGKIQLIYHHYPDSEFSNKLAQGLEAAGEQGKFWQMHDSYLEHVPGDLVELKTAAEQSGLNMQKFNQALDEDKFAETVRLAKEKAASRGVERVSAFINGKEYQKYPGTFSELCETIDTELAKQAENGVE